jgi:hypothetical protein
MARRLGLIDALTNGASRLAPDSHCSLQPVFALAVAGRLAWL